MDWIAGEPLDAYIAARECSINETLQLFAKICEAVQHAHQRGVIHRDLKPSNILIDTDGRPKILDFGLAKWMAAPMETLVSVSDNIVGTLPYMSPEQARGGADDVDTRADVYALGVILYELLTGSFPYPVTGQVAQVLRNIAESDPASLSKAWSPDSGIVKRSRRSSNRRCPIDKDLETIVLRALAKKRERRYQSAGDLARDLERYLSGDPVEARRDSTLYVLRKQVQRHRIALAVASSFVVLLITSSVEAWTLYLDSRDRLRDSYLAQAHAGRMTGRPGQRFDSLKALTKAAAIRPSIELRNEAIACLALTDMRVIMQEATGIDITAGVCGFSSRGDLYWLFDIETGRTTVQLLANQQTLLTLPSSPSSAYWTLPRFSRDGRYLARSVGTQCEMWDIERGERIKAISSNVSRHGQPYDFRPDAQEIAIGCEDGSIYIYNLTSDDARVLPPVHAPIHVIRYHPARNILATSSLRSHDALIRDALTGGVLHTLNHPHRLWCQAWSPDGRQLTTGCEDGNAYVWSAQTGLQQFVLGHMSAVDHVEYNAGGDMLFSAGWDGTTRLWDPRDGAHLLPMPAAQGHSFAGDSNRLFLDTRSQNLCVAVAEIVHGDTFRTLVGHPTDLPRDSGEWVQASDDGQWLASASVAGVRLWNLVQGREIAFLPTGRSVVFCRNRSALITVGRTEVLRWPLEIDSEVMRIGPPEKLYHPSNGYFLESCLTVDGRTLVFSAPDAGHAVVLDLDGDRETRTIGPHAGIRYVSISPDDRWLATGSGRAKGVKIWDLASGELVHELSVPSKASVAFSRDGKWLVTSEAEHVIWRTGTWEVRARFPRVNYAVVPGPIAFSPDGRLMAVANQAPPFQVALLDVVRLEQIATLECPGDMVMPESLVFTPDGTRLVFPNPQAGQVLYVWDLRALRTQLAALDLDWDLPPYPPQEPNYKPEPLRVEVDLGELAPPPNEVTQRQRAE